MPEETRKESRFSFASKPHGEGGFGRVIRGRDKELEREIAVKVLNPLLAFETAERERFRREARTLARLSHPNIPAIYDVIFEPDEFLLVFQFVEGTNLRKVLEEEGAADITKAQTWFRQVASALEHAHALGIVHRDVKPDNIIITPDGQTAYLVDWGISLSAQEVKRLTNSGGAIGTPGYMSPEQQAGQDVDFRSDLYSLGVTLYETLADKAIPQGQYEELAQLNQAIPPAIDELVRACLDARDRRPESAKVFTTRLTSAFFQVRPLSEVLGHGRLHEIALALRELEADSFMRLPDGQRGLILAKLEDIVGSDDPQLARAAAEFLQLLLMRGLLLDAKAYEEIARPAINRAFEREFDGKLGRRSLQVAIVGAAAAAQGGVFEILVNEFLAFMGRVSLADKPGWYLHQIRDTLQTLLANPSCTESAKDLTTALREVNRIQRQGQTPLGLSGGGAG